MTDLLFLNLARRARQVLLWLLIIFAGIGASGVYSFFANIHEGTRTAVAHARVQQGISLLYLSAFLFFIGSLYHLWVSRRYKPNTAIKDEDAPEPTPHKFIRLPSGVDLNIHADPEEVLKVLRNEDYSTNQGFWKELRQTYCRSPFKKSDGHNRIRTFLLEKTR